MPIEQSNMEKTYEDALLGFLIVDESKMLETSEILPSADYFTDPDNKASYAILLKLYNDDKYPGSPALIVKALYGAGDKKHFTTEDEAARYVNRLLDSATINSAKFNPSAYREYAEQIKWDYQRRSIKAIATETLAKSDRVSYDDREEFIGEIEDRLADVTMQVHGKGGLKHISEMTDDIASQIDMLHSGRKLASGMKTGIDSIDEALNGLRGGEVCVLAGRPSLGKTTLSLQIAYNIATAPIDEDGKQNAVLIFSLEMMEEQLISRMIAMIGRVNMQSFMDDYQHYVSENGKYYENNYSKKFQDRMHDMLEEEYSRTQIALDRIRELPIYPTTESGLSPNSIKSMVMQKKREIERNGQKLSLIVIDYLQLMVPNLGKTNASRTEEVGDMSRKMKLLAKEFDVPILLLAQLNRNADVTERPNLKDLRESGSIEQDADKVLFIWNPEANKTVSDYQDLRDDNARREALNRDNMKIVVSIAKNRQGETKDCDVIFDKGFQTFVSQSDNYSQGAGEQFDDFFAKYYYKTRNEDIFWPLMNGEIPEDLESHRTPIIRERPYLDDSGTLHSSTSEITNAKSKVTLKTSTRRAIAGNIEKTDDDIASIEDKSEPNNTVIDDLSTGFEELDDGNDNDDDVKTNDTSVSMEHKANSSESKMDEQYVPNDDDNNNNNNNNNNNIIDSRNVHREKTLLIDDDDDEELDMDNLDAFLSALQNETDKL